MALSKLLSRSFPRLSRIWSPEDNTKHTIPVEILRGTVENLVDPKIQETGLPNVAIAQAYSGIANIVETAFEMNANAPGRENDGPTMLVRGLRDMAVVIENTLDPNQENITFETNALFELGRSLFHLDGARKNLIRFKSNRENDPDFIEFPTKLQSLTPSQRTSQAERLDTFARQVQQHLIPHLPNTKIYTAAENHEHSGGPVHREHGWDL